jgi:hypothetical protein
VSRGHRHHPARGLAPRSAWISLRLRCARHATSPGEPALLSPTSRATPTRQSSCWAQSGSMSPIRVSARSAGCPVSVAGPRSWLGSYGPVGACSCVRVTRCSGRSATRDRTGCSWWSTRTFETEGVHFREETTYAGSGVVNSPNIISFNHGLGEIFTAMPDAGMTMRSLQEHREVPPECTRRRDGVKSRASRRVCPGYST